MRSTLQNANTLIALACSILLTACSSAPKVATDYDPKYDFTGIKSYYLIDQNQASGSAAAGTGLVDQRVRRAIEAEMEKRGIPDTSADKAGIIISYQIVTQDKTKVTSYNSTYAYRGYGYGYRNPYYNGAQVDVRQYTEGTLLIDLVAPNEKRVVWRGEASAIVKNLSTEEREARVKAYVEAICSHMPPPLGSKQ